MCVSSIWVADSEVIFRKCNKRTIMASELRMNKQYNKSTINKGNCGSTFPREMELLEIQGFLNDIVSVQYQFPSPKAFEFTLLV